MKNRFTHRVFCKNKNLPRKKRKTEHFSHERFRDSSTIGTIDEPRHLLGRYMGRYLINVLLKLLVLNHDQYGLFVSVNGQGPSCSLPYLPLTTSAVPNGQREKY